MSIPTDQVVDFSDHTPHFECALETEDALIAAAKQFAVTLTVKGVGDALLDAVDSVFGVRGAWVLLRDGAGFRAISWRGAHIASRDPSVGPGAGILDLACSGRRVVFGPSVVWANASNRDQPRDGWRMNADEATSLAAAPLVFGGQAIGVLAFDSPRFTPNSPPGDRDVARLEALASQAATAIAARFIQTGQTRGAMPTLSAPFSCSIIGDSPALKVALGDAALAAPGDTTILLLGETGSGKECFARFIHDASARARGPFVAVNCAALPEALVESELFGHEKGAFTGAVARTPGKFEAAHQGTLFLDEVGDLPPEAQAKLLRVLQERQVQRIGSTRTIRVDVRVITATNHDLEGAIAARAFRSDLYYRLSVFPIHIPPLRERRQDIPALARHFTTRFAATLGKPVAALSPEAIAGLQAYHWPGNVRELQNILERAIIRTEGDVIGLHTLDLPRDNHRDRPLSEGEVQSLAETDRRAIVAALEASGWRVSGRDGAADRLRLKPTTLHSKMKKLGIRRGDKVAADRPER